MDNKERARMFAKYWGCQCEVIFDGVHSRFIEISGYSLAMILYHPDNEKKEYRLILSPLSSISDEDAIEVAKIGGRDMSDNTFKINMGKSLVNEYWRRVSNVDAATWVEIIDFLRSCSYDLDNLLTSSLAIEQAKIKN